jgi:general L-amino acid transport system permease protein
VQPNQKKYLAIFFFVIFPVLAFWLLYGGLGLEVVETRLWGGFMLTLILSGIGIIFSLPLGVLLALGRRSELPVVHMLCVVLIEFVRGVPLLTILFMANVMLPFFLPPGIEFNVLLRVLLGVTIFAAAYMAEVVRGGLQALPKGQYEGAMAMGLGYWQMMRLIILPQALRVAIPGIVNNFISLAQDTTLVAIVGLYDFLNIVRAGSRDTNWLGTEIEGYAFCALVYWVFCFAMSRYSMYLERKLHTGHKKR